MEDRKELLAAVGPWGFEMFEAIGADDREKASRLIEAGWTYGPVARDPGAAGLGHGLWSPVEFAAFEGSDDVLELMLEAGGRAREGSPGRDRPSLAIHFAAQLSEPRCLRLLLAAGADPAALDERGAPPLHRVALTGSRECAQALVAAGADPNAKDWGGATALCEAVSEAAPCFVEALLDLGADPWMAQGGLEEGELFARIERHATWWESPSLSARLAAFREARELEGAARAGSQSKRAAL